ncbi:MAG TPA: T9SS type A sorting domain-containing protein [Bacteroidia bacterium]|nr:T9SS type A sorting domain-containing protein [Bacteroidia bacterium]HMU20092.1 T9SS type A sorting domain-containing protein [Bacteroidia bacterium]
MKGIANLMKLGFISAFMFTAIDIDAQTTITYTADGTFTVPAGVTTVKVEAWGGGGAGGGTSAGLGNSTGGGGGGGAFKLNNSLGVTAGSAITVTVGDGGTGGSNVNGNNGGNSDFGGMVTADGGKGGKKGNNGAGGGSTSGTHNGGAGAAGSGGKSGGGGGGAGATGNGGNASGMTGGTGGAGGGGTGASGLSSSGDGIDASALAAGGGGGRSNFFGTSIGGDGYRGQVKVTYTCATFSLTATNGTSPICVSSPTSVITLTGTAASLPVGDYVVTYNRSLPSGSNLTASMSVLTAGTGSFTATGLTSAGNSTITVTNLTSSYCSSNISTNRTTVISVAGSAPAQPDVITGAPANVCPPTGSYTLSTNSAGADSYNWYLGSGVNGVTFLSANGSNTMDVQFGTTSNSTYVIRVDATNACGTSAYRPVLIRRATSVPSAISGLKTACASTSDTYTANAVDGATEYVWSISGDASVTGNTNSVTVNFGPAWTGGTLCVASKVGCFTSATKCMAIATSATPLSTVLGGTFKACPNGSLNFNVTATPGVATYNWTVPTNASINSGQGTNAITVDFNSNYNNTGNICMTATSICGVVAAPKCKSVSPGLPSVPASVTGGTNGLCNENAPFSTAMIPGVTSYNWTAPGTINNNGNNAVTVQFGAFTYGSVCVSATNACGTSATRCVSIKGAPNTPASITATPGTWCPNTAGVEFNASIANVTGAYTLSWTYPETSANYVSGGGNSSSLTLDWTTGNGAVMLTASNACGSGTKVFNVVLDNCREAGIDAAQQLEVYPNPANDLVNISYQSDDKELIKMSLMDYSGKLIYIQNIQSGSGMNNYSLDVSKFAPGVYMLNIQSKNGNVQRKLIKQ